VGSGADFPVGATGLLFRFVAMDGGAVFGFGADVTGN